MATVKRKSSSKKTAPNKVQQQWATITKKLALQQKKFQEKLRAIKKDFAKKVAEAETAITRISSSTMTVTARKAPVRGKSKRTVGSVKSKSKMSSSVRSGGLKTKSRRTVTARSRKTSTKSRRKAA